MIFIDGPSDLSLDYIHRRTDQEEIYFVRNATDREVDIEVQFRVQGKQPYFWDAVIGVRFE